MRKISRTQCVQSSSLLVSDTNSVHEPPRRVLVSLPASKITLSDYLFPGEGPQEAQISLQEMLDITVNEVDDINDIEGQAGILFRLVLFHFFVFAVLFI